MSLLLALPDLELSIDTLLVELSTAEDPATARKLYAKKLALAMYAFVKAGLVKTAGSASAQIGTVE